MSGDEENPSPLFTLTTHYSTELDLTDSSTLTAAQLVAHLRKVVVDETTPPQDRNAAAAALQELAQSNIPGADPSEWLGLAEPSTTNAVFADETVTVSPSKMKDIRSSAADWFVDRVGGTEKNIAMSLGSIIHKAMEIAEEPTIESMMAVVADRWNELEFDAPWAGEREREKTQEILEVVVKYLNHLTAQGAQLAIPEAKFSITLGGDNPDVGDPAELTAQIHGFIDRVEIGADGAITITDLKTGNYNKNRVGSGDDIDQLSAYQLAYFCHKLDDALAERVPGRRHHLGGAQLFYPKAVTNRNHFGLYTQDALSPERAAEFAADVLSVAQLMAAAEFEAPVELDSQDRSAATKRWIRVPEVCSD